MNQIITNKKGFIQILEVSKFLKCPNANESNGNDFLFQKHKNFIRTKSKFTYRHPNNFLNNKLSLEKRSKNHICDLLIKPKPAQRYASQNQAQNRFIKNQSLPDTKKTNNNNQHLNTNNTTNNSSEKTKRNDVRSMIILNCTAKVKRTQANNKINK